MTNPYNTVGISDEDRALIAVFQWAGGTPTSTTDHPVLTTSGKPSRHRMPGTNGAGLAVDGTTGSGAGNLAIFQAITERFGALLHEAICGQAAGHIKDGRTVMWTDSPEDKQLRAEHMGHVHLSVNRGVFLSTLLPESDGDDVPKDKDRVDACECWVSGCTGAFSLQYDGGVESVGDHIVVPAIANTPDHFRGSYFSLPDSVRNDPARRFYAIVPIMGQGYLILGKDGSFYGPTLP